MNQKLLRVPDVAELTGVSENTLRHWRHMGTGPKSARLGRRIVYRATDVEAWIEAQFAEAVGD
jgi:predicted DNA-binding transcriptional regulator AlpA